MSLLRLLEIEDRGGSNHGTVTDTPGELVAAPPVGFVRVVERLFVKNFDTSGTNRLRVFKTVSATDYEFAGAKDWEEDAELQIEGPVRLTDIDQSITAVLDNAVTGTAPAFVVSWRDVPIAT